MHLSDLVNVGKGMDEEGMYKFMDADFADGLYNGYRFTLTGCERNAGQDVSHYCRAGGRPRQGLLL